MTSRVGRSALLLTVGALVGSAVVGVGVAATSTSALKACADSKGALVLQSKGKCPKKTKSIKVGVTGPTGAAGPSGAPGQPGTPGTPGQPGQDLHHARIVAVDAAGTDLANGAALLAAVSTITDATTTKRYLVSVGPGKYDLGGATLTLPAYVDLTGSGRDLTTITSEGVAGAATVVGLGSTALRSVTISDNESGSHAGIGLSLSGVGSTYVVEDSTVSAYAIDKSASAIVDAGNLTIRRSSVSALVQRGPVAGAVLIKGIDVSASGYLTSIDSSFDVEGQGTGDNADAVSAHGGVAIEGGRLEANAAESSTASALHNAGTGYSTVTRSVLVAGGFATNYPVNDGGGGSVYAVDTQLYVVNTGAAVHGGTATCLGSYSGTYVALSATCT